MEKESDEERQSYRRKISERRRKPRPGPGRRKASDRRLRESLKGALTRAQARPTSAEKLQATTTVSPEVSRVTLYDIVLRSLGKAEPRRLAVELANRKLVPSVEEAGRVLKQTPNTLARYVAPEPANALCSALRATGADVVLQTSQATCPHCGSAVPCEGEPDPSQRGIMFSCPACQGQTYLDSRDRKFHPVLQCSACHSLLRLPSEARTGKYRCQCRNILSYDRFEPKMEFHTDQM